MMLEHAGGVLSGLGAVAMVVIFIWMRAAAREADYTKKRDAFLTRYQYAGDDTDAQNEETE